MRFNCACALIVLMHAADQGDPCGVCYLQVGENKRHVRTTALPPSSLKLNPLLCCFSRYLEVLATFLKLLKRAFLKRHNSTITKVFRVPSPKVLVNAMEVEVMWFVAGFEEDVYCSSGIKLVHGLPVRRRIPYWQVCPAPLPHHTM